MGTIWWQLHNHLDLLNLNSWGNGNSCGRWQSCFACLEKIERCPKSHKVIHVNLHVFMELQFLPTCAWTQRLQMNINSPKFLSGCFKYFLQIIWLLARLWLRSTAWSTIRATLTSHCNRSLPHCQPSLLSGLHHGGFPTDTFGLERSDLVVPFLCGIPPAIQKTSSTLRKLLCVPSQSECIGEGPLFWMGLPCGETKGRQSSLFERIDLHLHFQRGMAEVWCGHVQNLLESTSPKTRLYTASHLQPMWMRTSVLATLRIKKNVSYSKTFCQSSWGYQQLVSSAKTGELCQWWCCAGTTFPMILMLPCSDPALQEPGRQLYNTAELFPRIASLQDVPNIMKLPNMLVAIGGCDRTRDSSVPVRNRHHDKSFLSALLASMHELLLDMVNSGWSIV